MLAPRIRVVVFTMPMILISVGCASTFLTPMTTLPLSTDRMMAIGQTFERQGRFSEAQDVYQEILAEDPVSPAAERLLAVIAAADVTNAQNLPVEHLMNVGEFYERNGNINLAQGVYRQILLRQPDFDPARNRLNSIAAHIQRKQPTSPSTGTEHVRSTSGQRVGPLAATALGRTYGLQDANPSSKNLVDPTQSNSAGADSGITYRFERTPGQMALDNSRADSQATISLSFGDDENSTETNPSSHSIQFAHSNESDSRRFLNEPVVPPSPSELTPDKRSAPGGIIPRNDATAAETRSLALWQDKPLNQLKASISLKLAESEPLRESERRRLTQAAPHLASNGSFAHSLGQSRPWMLTSYEWEAPATRHLPLFFEEPNVERMGYTYGFYWNICGYESGRCAAECLQPIVSGAHFFGRVAMIPYICGIDPPCEPVYTLGVDRPGSPVPYRKHLVPISFSGIVYQAGTVVGIGYLIP